ncbi:MAG TPA: hypothetical protein VGW78_00060 [Candidatus Babeliales bacterium]|jgi:hypothetical protein|nr:hypothetical protein [Candidatus Babeliales bacterium]
MNKKITLKCECNQYLDIETPCCDLLKQLLNDCSVHLHYSRRFRRYSIQLLGKNSVQQMIYCFCCGKKFPESLFDKWYETLEKEYGLNDPTSKKQEKLIPAEFQTDEWWKKRGL